MMYTLRHLPPDCRTDVRGLSLDEAFVRMMALASRQFMFSRTGWTLQLLMTNVAPGEPEFLSHATNNAVARQDIKGQVCRHGLGLFLVMTDAEYARWSVQLALVP
jgi:hypothetical protein